MNDLAIKETIDEIKGKIILNEKVTNQILEIIKMDINAACDFAKEVQFKDNLDDETRNRLCEKLFLLAIEMCIDADQPAMDLLEYAYDRKEPFMEKLIEFLKKRAEEDNGMALYMMGNCYEEGIGVEKDSDKARRFFISAAAEGNHGSTFIVAKDAYHRRDKKYAVALFKDMAEQGDEIAKCALAFMTLLNEKLAGTDKAKAVEELRNDWATKEIVEMAFIVGYCYMMGLYVDEDTKVGSEFLHISAGLIDESTKEQGEHLRETCLMLDFKLIDLLHKLEDMADNVLDYNEQPLDDYMKVLDFMLEDIEENKL